MEGSGASMVLNTNRYQRLGQALDDDVEEIERSPASILARRSSSCTDRARSHRPPIRRRLRPDESNGKSYQMFEISTARSSMDASDTSSSAFTVVSSATSICTDSWSPSGFVEEEEEEVEQEESGNFTWEQADDMLLPPKLEPVEDVDMAEFSDAKDDLKESEAPESPTSVSQPADLQEAKDVKDGAASPRSITHPAARRGRGRPRKHPIPTPESLAKVTKGRSKTGCLTCRKRKKKCDETKPGCMNCEKNSVECEGYPVKTIWKSGKERAEEAARLRRAGSFTFRSIPLPTLINGIETEGDRIFLHHYINHLSLIFTLEGENDSAFRNLFLPIAQDNQGLMHSILALAAGHIDYNTPYGQALLIEHPRVTIEGLKRRSDFHKAEAFKTLTGPQEDRRVLFGQMVCEVLNTLNDPKPSGAHRVHLEHYQRLIEEKPVEDGEFMKFIHEFFQYHIHADKFLRPPERNTVQYVYTTDGFNLPSIVEPRAVRLLGVFDGLFHHMAKITNLRQNIRHNIEHGIDPPVDYRAYYAAAEIDAGIREWTPVWPAGDPRDQAGMLYRQTMWIYLWRTIHPPQRTNWKLHPNITAAVNDGIKLLSAFKPSDPSQTLNLTPSFIIGCAAFEPEQRDAIRKAIRAVKAYMGYKNSDIVREVLEEVWRLMDLKDEASWDWESVAERMGVDLLAT